jgi:cobalamin biosynthetic protein CobC
LAEGIGILSDPEHIGAGDRLPHGGRLREAARRYGIPPEAWLDLSTGINPHAYPVPAIPLRAWVRLPEDDDGLIDAARAYYEAPHVLPVAGSQVAIQALPPLRRRSHVGIITPGYAEHARAWRRAGHEVVGVPVEALGNAARQVDVLVVIHPNNPTGDRFAVETLLGWRWPRHPQGLASRGRSVHRPYPRRQPCRVLCAAGPHRATLTGQVLRSCRRARRFCPGRSRAP